MISKISPIVNFATILKTAWCVISCIGFTEIQRSRNMSKYIPFCYAPINVRPAGGEAGQGGGI